MADDFKTFFKQATGCTLFPYQRRLADPSSDLPELLQVPTGTGKTAAAVLSSAANPPS
jgi:CRISPR-associated endonuclease/helicase Cas3